MIIFDRFTQGLIRPGLLAAGLALAAAGGAAAQQSPAPLGSPAATRVIDGLQSRSIPFDMMLYPGQRPGVRGNERQLQQWRTYLDFLDRTIGSRAPAAQD